MEFNILTSPHIVFKTGAVKNIGNEVKGFGKKPLIIHGRSLEDKFIASISASLAENGLEGVFFVNLPGEPSPETVDTAAKAYFDNKCDFIISVGGGSVMDTGKVLSGLATNGGCLKDYLEGVGSGKKIVNDPVPFVAVPTTHGTGAELTKNGVISSSEEHYKKSVRDNRLVAKLVIVDAELMVSLPKKETASCSLDALTQLIEAYTSCKSNPFTDALCISGLEAAAESIYEVYDNGTNVAAREKMAYAAMLSGLCLANAGLGAAHGLAPALGITYGISHGESCALVLDHVMRYNIPFAVEKFAKIGRILTKKQFSSDRDAAVAGADYVRELKKHLNIPAGLSHLSIKEEDIPVLIKRVSSNSLKANTVPVSDNELAKIIRSAM